MTCNFKLLISLDILFKTFIVELSHLVIVVFVDSFQNEIYNVS